MSVLLTYSSSMIKGVRNINMMTSILSKKVATSVSSLSSFTTMSLQRPVQPLLISIEGNIGAGKSTLLNSIKSLHPEWRFIDEPVTYWSTLRNDDNESMLEVFYKDRRRWSYTFQNCAMLSRFQNIQDAVENNIVPDNNSNGLTIMKNIDTSIDQKDDDLLLPEYRIFITERCMDTDYHVFTKMLRDEGSIDKLEYELYKKLYNHLKKTAVPLAAIIHIGTQPDVCADRILKRGRSGEQSIPIEYLRKLDEYQRAWVTSTNVPHVTTYEGGIKHVEDFIKNLILDKSKKDSYSSPNM